MLDETKYESSMQIILHAGNAKSSALMAIDSAAEGEFEEADKQLEEARSEMNAAHKFQFDMIHEEANGNPVDVNIILVHAQDHLTMATMATDLGERIVDLYKLIDKKLP